MPYIFNRVFYNSLFNKSICGDDIDVISYEYALKDNVS